MEKTEGNIQGFYVLLGVLAILVTGIFLASFYISDEDSVQEAIFEIGDITIHEKGWSTNSSIGDFLVFARISYYGYVVAYNGLDHTLRQYNMYKLAKLSDEPIRIKTIVN